MESQGQPQQARHRLRHVRSALAPALAPRPGGVNNSTTTSATDSRTGAGAVTSSAGGRGDSATAGAPGNSAFVFTKPHADTPAVRALVTQQLLAAGCAIRDSGSIDGATIAARGYIDRHYYSIASKATLLRPTQLNVPEGLFRESFGEDWGAVLEEGRAYNALEACEALGLSPHDLNERWERADAAGDRRKLGGGFYCARLPHPSQADATVYTFNAFFMALRAQFTAPGASITWFCVDFKPEELSWARFRAEVIGSTDPEEAPAGSLRGMLAARWAELGLEAPPDNANNGVHASASPLEGFAERSNWLCLAPHADGFGRLLLGLGLSAETVAEWQRDPQLRLEAGGEGSLFDALEGVDAGPCLAACARIAALNR